MTILILLLFFNFAEPKPPAQMIVRTPEEAAVTLWQQVNQRPATTAKLYKVTITPTLSVVEEPIPIINFGPPPAVLPPIPVP